MHDSRAILRAATVATLLSVAALRALAQQGRGLPSDTPVPLPQRPPTNPQALVELQRDLGDLLDDPNFGAAQWGLVVESLESGEQLFKRNLDKLFMPASALKMMTSAAALHVLGPDFRYTTSLYASGTIGGGDLRGDLVIRGSGDPTLSRRFSQAGAFAALDRWCDTLEALGVKTVTGNVIGDDSYFDTNPYAPGWELDDLPYGYGAPVDALSMNDNCVNVTASPGETRGDPARLELTPNTAYVTITNEVRTSREDSAFGIDVHREPGTNAIRLTGTIALHATPARVDASIDNPALYVATLLREALARRGIAVRGPALATSEIREKQKYASMTLLDAISSPPLSEIVDVLNHQSVNLYAELILKTMAKERTGEGSFARGASLVRQYLIDIGIAADRLSIVDGSGLSRLDLVSPHAFATLLRAVQRNRGWKAFLNSLPVAGKSGTLESRLKGTCAEGTVRAKTGTLTFARSLAGYATTKDDETLVFALLCNNFTVPVSLADNIQDLVLMRLANFSRR